MSTTNKPFDIGQRIHELRTNRRLSQEQLALRSNITPTYLGLIERNLKNPTLKVIEQLCNALNISLADFFISDTAQNETCEPDNFSQQILTLINSCTDKEKQYILRIIKYLLRFKENR